MGELGALQAPFMETAFLHTISCVCVSCVIAAGTWVGTCPFPSCTPSLGTRAWLGPTPRPCEACGPSWSPPPSSLWSCYRAMAPHPPDPCEISTLDRLSCMSCALGASSKSRTRWIRSPHSSRHLSSPPRFLHTAPALVLVPGTQWFEYHRPPTKHPVSSPFTCPACHCCLSGLHCLQHWH
jgi:hypothetical protein